MASWGKSSCNYTTKYCLGFFCLSAIPPSLLLLPSLASLLNVSPPSQTAEEYFLSFTFVMWNRLTHYLFFPTTTCLLSLLLPSSAVIFLGLICSIIYCPVMTTVSSPLFYHLGSALHITRRGIFRKDNAQKILQKPKLATCECILRYF